MKEIECVQGSEQWWEARKGIVTASEASRVVQAEEGKVSVPLDMVQDVIANREFAGVSLSPGQVDQLQADALKAGKTRKYGYFTGVVPSSNDARTRYAAELIAERRAGWMKSDFGGSPDIERGLQLESEARKWVEFELGETIRKCGIFLGDCDRYGASPDGMTESGHPVEIKCPDFHTQYRYILNGKTLPNDYKQQVHLQLAVTGAPFGWFVSYVADSRVPSFIIKVESSDYTRQLREHVEVFCGHLEDKYQRIHGEVAA